MSALLDTNVIIRHLTGEPREQARKARALLESGEPLVLTDLIAAECVFVLSSVYELEPPEIAQLMRAVIAFESIEAPGAAELLRALELFEAGHDFADAYLVACAEATGAAVASFDKGIGRISPGVVRIP